jgi:hypothetical protein
MALSTQTQSVDFGSAAKASASPRTTSKLRLPAKPSLPDARWIAAAAAGLAFLATGTLVLLLLPSADRTNTEAVSPSPVAAAPTGSATLDHSLAAVAYLDPHATKRGETIVSRNSQGLIQREESLYSDGSSDITAYDYDAHKRKLRITVYNRDGTTSTKDFTYSHK